MHALSGTRTESNAIADNSGTEYRPLSPLLSCTSNSHQKCRLSPQQRQYQMYSDHSTDVSLLQPRYHGRVRHLHHWETSARDNRNKMQSAMKHAPHSPDPGCLESINGYFPQIHPDYVPVEGTLPGDDSHTEDEEDEGDVQGNDEEISLYTQNLAQNNGFRGMTKRGRRRSPSVHELLSSARTPLNSSKACETRLTILPANTDDGVTTTAPPQPRIAYLSRRRRHSCVEPNTKEFHTLTAIFDWVAMSAQDAWPKILGKQLEEITEIKAVPPTQRCDGIHPAVCGSHDNSDFDGGLQYGEMMEWSLSLESRDPEFTDNRFQSPNRSMELLAELGNLSLDATLNHKGDSDFPRHQRRHSRPGLSEVLRNRQTFVSDSKVEQNGWAFSVAPRSPFEPQRDCTKSQPKSITYNTPSDVNTLSRERGQDVNQLLELSSVVSENFVETGWRQKPTEFSLLCKTASSDDVYVENSLDSIIVRTNESSLMPPLSFCSGKDSGYIPISCSCSNSSTQPFVIDIEQNINDIQEERDCLPAESDLRMNNGFDRANADICLSSVEYIPDEASAPHIPSQCPENDAHGFDHAEDEGPDTIVYGPLEGDPNSGNYELRPIVAATVAKLIEKLTHQYGMDSKFVSDFFLTFRLFMSPMQLCKYLIQRYLWSLEQDSGIRHIVRVRTFVVIRYWLNKHFEDDFLPSKALRFQMESFLREVRSDPRVQTSAVDSRIILSLSHFYKRQRQVYKTLAERALMNENRCDSRNKADQGISHSDLGYPESGDMKVSEVGRLDVSAIHSNIEPLATKTTLSDVTGTKSPIKGRNRASTLASITAKSMVREAHGSCPNYKSPLLNGSQATSASMSRQLSEGGSVMPRERRLSTSSIKTHKGVTIWSTKVTLGINKLRQKSEDIYQQFVHSANGSSKNGDSRTCVCWTPEYTGIAEHHALNTTRSLPSLRPSVVVANVSQELFSPQSSASCPNPVHPSSKSIKRLKSTVSLGRSSPVAELSPAPSPTRNQFSSISCRHSRSNSNSSAGYHPNPYCPFHTECLGVVGADASEKTQELLDNTSTTLQEALQDDFADTLTRPSISRVQASIPPSPGYSPWFTVHRSSSSAPVYKPFILYYRSQLIAQQLCLLEQHFLEEIRWNELLEEELAKAGRRNRSKCQFSIGGYLFKTERERNGVDASNERSNMLCMWVASEVVSTHPIEDRVRVIEKFIRIAQKCHQYRNYNSLFHLVMGLGSSHLCTLRRTWSKVRSYEMRILQELQHFILPYSNWGLLRKAMSQVDYQETLGDSTKRFSAQGLNSTQSCRGNAESVSSNQQSSVVSGYSRYINHHSATNEQGCIPFLGLFIFDLTHISVSSPWYLPQTPTPQDEGECKSQESCSLPSESVRTNNAGVRLQAPDPKDLQRLIPTGKLLVHFHRYKLIAKTIKWFMAFQRRSQKYTFAVDSTLYSKCFLLRVLSDKRIRELADSCEGGE